MYIYMALHMILGQLFPKNGQIYWGYITYMYMYGLAHDFGAIVPKKRADIVEVHYIDICTYMVLHMILGQLFPKNGQILCRFIIYMLCYTYHLLQ